MKKCFNNTGNTPKVIIQPPKGLIHLKLRELWEYRELLYFLIWRDVKVRYKQTMIGAGWAIIQPLFAMLIFTTIFGNFAKIPSDGMPYSIFVFAGLLPWTYFSQAIGRSGLSLVSDSNLIRKIYFPRLTLPLAAGMAPSVDFLFSFLILLGLMLWYGIFPVVGIWALPLFMIMAFLTSMAVSLWLSPLNVKYRDVGHTIPFLIQIWMYASPVVYPINMIPDRWRLVYSLNPMAGVIEGFRWALLNKQSPDFRAMVISGIVVLGLLVGGLFFFKRMERTFADVV